MRRSTFRVLTTAAVATLAALATAAGASADSDATYQVPAFFITLNGHTVLSQEMPIFTSRCYRPAGPINGTVTNTKTKTKTNVYRVSGQFQTSDGLTMSWQGAYTAGRASAYSGKGSGSWRATGLPAACQRGGAATAQGTYAMAWVPMGDGVTQRFTFTAFSPS